MTTLCLVCGLVAHPALGEEPSRKDAAEKYRALINQLASPNKMPVVRNGSHGRVKFPAGYDVQAQKRIDQVRHELQDQAEEALPYLLDAYSDGRYCMTIDWAGGDAYYNESVGEICRDIVASQLEVYRDPIEILSSQHSHYYDYPTSKLWWEKRQQHGLARLQVEAFEWAIKQRLAEPKDEIKEGRENEVAMLQKLRDQIAKSGKPAKAMGMYVMRTTDSRDLP